MYSYELFEKKLGSRKLILFGASTLALRTMILHLPDYEVAYFIDNNPQKHGTLFFDRPVYPPDKLKEEDPDKAIILITSMYRIDIECQLLEMTSIPIIGLEIFQIHRPDVTFAKKPKPLAERFEQFNNIYPGMFMFNWLYKVFSDDKSKYILKKILQKCALGDQNFSDIREEGLYFNEFFEDCLSENEVFVDAGVSSGSTTLDFIRYANNKFKKVYAFEPDPINYWACCNNLSKLGEKIEIINAGVYDINGKVGFSACRCGSSRVSDNDFKIDVVTLGDTIKEEVTFIKMDIEGSEFQALLGAQNIIRAYKPKLAICVYHKHEDIWKLPVLIHEMVPEYKLFLRHHGQTYLDTVLYARI